MPLLLLFFAQSISAQSVAIIGDSNTWLGGDDCKGAKGWSHWFVEYFKPTVCKSYARSGATWTSTTNTKHNLTENIGSLGDNNVAYNQLQRLFADKTMQPDIVIIALGTNDLWFSKKRPSVFAHSKQDFSGEELRHISPSKLLTMEDCVLYAVKNLRHHYPNARIFFTSPAQCIHIQNSVLTRFGNTLESLGKQQNVSTIRLDKLSPIDSSKEKIAKEYTYDGTHTSEKGAKAIGAIITDFIKAALGR